MTLDEGLLALAILLMLVSLMLQRATIRDQDATIRSLRRRLDKLTRRGYASGIGRSGSREDPQGNENFPTG